MPQLALTRTTKESLKIALAMVVTYAIVLSANWGETMWAGLAVTMVSQPSMGLSLNKGALRLCGTVLALIVSLTLMSLFPQQRWMFMVALSLWVGLSMYMMLGSRRPYFWDICGFVTVIVCVHAALANTDPFYIAMLRAQDTTLGVLVYSIIAMLIWPLRSSSRFSQACAALHDSQTKLLQQCRLALQDPDAAKDIQKIRDEMIRAQSGLGELLQASESDSYDIWESRQRWRQYLSDAEKVTQILAQLSDSLDRVSQLPLKQLLPNLAEYIDKLESRLAQLNNMLENQQKNPVVEVGKLDVAEQQAKRLPMLDAGSLTLLRRKLADLEERSRTMFYSLQGALGGATGQNTGAAVVTAPQQTLLPDPDRVAATLRIMLTLWVAYLAYLYVDGIPGGPVFVILTIALGMNLARAPQVPPLKLIIPMLISITLVGFVYIFIMPKLAGFTELGILIFLFTFFICQVFSAPEKEAGRVVTLAVFVGMTSISNSQGYSFLVVANMALLFPMALLLLGITAYFPRSLRPQTVVQRLLQQFCSSAVCLLRLTLRGGKDPAHSSRVRGFIDQWRLRYHYHLLSTIPAKIATWSPKVDAHFLPGKSADDLQSLVSALMPLGYEICSMVDEWQSSATVGAEVRGDTAQRLWRQRVAAEAARLSSVISSVGDYVSGNDGESAVVGEGSAVGESEALSSAVEMEGPDSAEIERLLNLVGMAREATESSQSLENTVRRIDWTRWKSEIFL
ncbi:p-hydroxybenzoic acid efflux subunit AaeB [Microbulbifer aggregans]|uniref:p-hydroxybenzoic acid efflux subunit AaeB n=1 Tax=Microbulbifer aggregans TaxID=1769779 RepID=A0A1C9W8W9_9GAMM|nr:FUSC family protein [Microbulbifer aggregans]AOS97590.1 p-hydroxybenzoic acid efflux subunit AaeB [Microbulbifer aggregans]